MLGAAFGGLDERINGEWGRGAFGAASKRTSAFFQRSAQGALPVAAGGARTRLPRAAYHSATEPSAWRHSGLRQRCPVFASSRTWASLISMPRPGALGIATCPSA